ncbi:DnaJ domain-containing protein [Waterburya agarophytonicola K14]|uniref:DnaJ domain-containing protein n=1 Tax=Waterburya agarophytonicola KI4 TaxID=2874699 RepID=A0A964FEX5_9CYAN|nr:DnaJ domain-containing protein [Waterburya agarophytonicola KI4]
MNHYQTLQVNSQATQQEIKQAYRRLAKQFHPDSQRETKNCDRIIALNAAYEIIGNSKSRRLYDRQQQLGQTNDFFVSRQTRNAAAQKQYQQRKANANPEITYQQWLREIYHPICFLVEKILQPLEMEIEELSADPFDDDLMESFATYLDTCNDYWQQAQQKLASKPNPPQLAGVAANLYYCLNHIGDGIKELQWFTMNYNDQYLHTGQEIFRIAGKLHLQAQERVHSVL